MFTDPFFVMHQAVSLAALNEWLSVQAAQATAAQAANQAAKAAYNFQTGATGDVIEGECTLVDDAPQGLLRG